MRCREVREGGCRSICRCMIHTGFVSGPSVCLSKEQLDGACGDARYPEEMGVELCVEATSGEYRSNPDANRLEAYEGLLLDSESALWRELLYRKSRRSAPSSPPVKGVCENKSSAFDIESEEEGTSEVGKLPLPTVDPGRDVGVVRV